MLDSLILESKKKGMKPWQKEKQKKQHVVLVKLLLEKQLHVNAENLLHVNS